MVFKKEKQSIEPIRVMVFGTFDMVHAGHRNMFQQARDLVNHFNSRNSGVKNNSGVKSSTAENKLKPYLIVSIARDRNVKRIKGRNASRGERARMEMVGKARGVNKVVLGATGNHIPHIVKEKPDIIALGYDQTAYVSGLKSELKKVGLKTKVVRLKPYKEHIYKTSFLKNRKLK